MAKSQARATKKPTGARYKSYRKKKLHELGNEPTLTKLGQRKIKKFRVLSAHTKISLLTENVANVFDKKTNKHQKVAIKAILENPANSQFVRRNIITKGTVIDTELGKARVTSRPGQEGTINAILI